MLKIGVKQNGKLVFVSNALFFVPGKNLIKFNPDSLGREAVLVNNEMKSFQNLHLQKLQLYQNNKSLFTYNGDSTLNVFLKHLEAHKENSLAGNPYQRINNALFELYVKQNNTSYMALWLLANNISALNINQFEAIFKKFSPSLQQSFLGKRINKQMKEVKSLLSGKRFLNWPLYNKNLILKTIYSIAQ